MALRVKWQGPSRGAYASTVRDYEKPIAKAVTSAFRDGAKVLEQEARANIASARLSRRFQTGFRAQVFPRQISLAPAIVGTHRIGFVNVFERGSQISGKPLLWLPLPTAPEKIGGKRITPRLYIQSIGPLIRINRPGKPPLLAGRSLKPIVGRAPAGVLRTGARHAAARRAGQRGRRTVIVPLFIGLKSVQLRKRLNISPMYDQVKAALPELYASRFRQEGF